MEDADCRSSYEFVYRTEGIENLLTGAKGLYHCSYRYCGSLRPLSRNKRGVGKMILLLTNQ